MKRFFLLVACLATTFGYPNNAFPYSQPSAIEVIESIQKASDFDFFSADVEVRTTVDGKSNMEAVNYGVTQKPEFTEVRYKSGFKVTFREGTVVTQFPDGKISKSTNPDAAPSAINTKALISTLDVLSMSSIGGTSFGEKYQIDFCPKNSPSKTRTKSISVLFPDGFITEILSYDSEGKQIVERTTNFEPFSIGSCKVPGRSNVKYSMGGHAVVSEITFRKISVTPRVK